MTSSTGKSFSKDFYDLADTISLRGMSFTEEEVSKIHEFLLSKLGKSQKNSNGV